MKNRYSRGFRFEVRVPDNKDPRNGHDTLEWLESQGKSPGLHFNVDMHSGNLGYTSFWFKDRLLAIRTLLIWG